MRIVPWLLGIVISVSLAFGVAPIAQTPQRFIFSDPLTLPAQLPDEGQAVKRVRYVEVNLARLDESTADQPFTAASLIELNLFPDVFLVALLESGKSNPGRPSATYPG